MSWFQRSRGGWSYGNTLVREFMTSFLQVFTVLQTTVNSDFDVSSMVSSWLLFGLSLPFWYQQRTLFPIFRHGMLCNGFGYVPGPMSPHSE